ncbi:hypothetical protein DF037_27565 [Burkholderia contaminans]|uniref:OmpA-like domain-containing protein n=1 Tax=Burkholderia contaminans TaxID=488447 RepID=A0A3N8QTT7_9BURK|nr:hypothetical protein DF037_27565 [Burkholderia contaminans]
MVNSTIHSQRTVARLTVLLVLMMISPLSVACTVMEFMETTLPFNAPELSNQDRLRVAEMMIEARKWPGATIGADVVAGAYVGERNRDRLMDARANDVKSYLKQLGVDENAIWINKLTFTEDMARNRNGDMDLHQIAIQLVPLCERGCGYLCNDPRVMPTSNAIR